MKSMELQELLSLDALGVLDPAGRARLEVLLRTDPALAEDAGLWRDAVRAFAAAVIPRQRPPANLRERILTRIRHSPQLKPNESLPPQVTPLPEAPSAPATPEEVSPVGAPGPTMSFDFAAAAQWLTVPEMPGVRLRILSVNAAQGYRIMQAVLQPGTRFPAHHHGAGPEDLFIVSGDLVTEGRTLRAGDHFHAEPGTDHGEIVSPSGCEAILIEPVAGPEFAQVGA